jgi:uncharacterized protein
LKSSSVAFKLTVIIPAIALGLIVSVLIVSTQTHTANQPTSFGTPAFGQYYGQYGQAQNEKTLTVSGSATIKAIPDRVYLVFSVVTRDKTAAVALDQNSITMNNVLHALNKTGIATGDMSTANLDITPIVSEAKNGYPGNITGYDVTNSISITSSKITSISKLIDTAVNAGANRVNNVQFVFSPEKLKSTEDGLIKAAIADAKSRADLVASAAGVTITGVGSININEGSVGPYYNLQLAEPIPAGVGAVSTPIISGEQELSVTANVVYLIS